MSVTGMSGIHPLPDACFFAFSVRAANRAILLVICCVLMMGRGSELKTCAPHGAFWLAVLRTALSWPHLSTGTRIQVFNIHLSSKFGGKSTSKINILRR
jgi:hypothetical protein